MTERRDTCTAGYAMASIATAVTMAEHVKTGMMLVAGVELAMGKAEAVVVVTEAEAVAVEEVAEVAEAAAETNRLWQTHHLPPLVNVPIDFSMTPPAMKPSQLS